VKPTPPDATFKPLANRKTVDGVVRYELPEDGFLQLVPIGRAPNALEDGTPIMQVVDEQAIAAMLNRAVKAGGRLLIDDEHFSRDPEKSTDAMGWLTLSTETLEARADGLYGKPDLTPKGMEALTNGVKLFISPEFPAPPSDGIQELSKGVYRPLSVVGFGLTNRPNFRTAKPLANRDHDKPNQNKTMLKPLVADLLGVTETELDALPEDALKNRFKVVKDSIADGTKAKSDLVALQNRQADEFITSHDAIIPKNDAMRDHLKKTFLANRELAEGMVNAFKTAKQDPAAARGERKPLHNRADAKVPADQSDADTKVKALHNRAQRYRDQHKVSYEKALAAVRAEGDAE
jgi:phage I-like protein